ncbi:hypothetical protein OOK13_43760 [Streptomyces sp. NBC_00378]|uniref:hypothetical protein n=1 Tax=unclassified Streptomyces TaxID=2593676 RepID=UPI0022586949|nr:MULTISPECIES: hypothetical protein [unclassified Streptomyces]MCX5115245.1 hypothetical protein [Streptomyces sp. NBC_00378]
MAATASVTVLLRERLIVETAGMATLEAIYGLVGVLGGATIGALSAGLIQRSSRKANEFSAARAQSIQTKQLALEATAAARVATRSWALHVELVVQNLESDRPVDVDSYDTTVRELLDVLTTALYRLTAIDGVELVDGEPTTSARSSLTETSTLIRKVLLQRLGDRPLECDPTELLARTRKAAEAMNLLLVRQTEHLRGSALPSGFGYPQPGQPFAVASDSSAQEFQPFWFAVPTARSLVSEDGGSAPILGLTPGTWYLAVDRAGEGLVTQTMDGCRGVLQDTTGIERG